MAGLIYPSFQCKPESLSFKPLIPACAGMTNNNSISLSLSLAKRADIRKL